MMKSFSWGMWAVIGALATLVVLVAVDRGPSAQKPMAGTNSKSRAGTVLASSPSAKASSPSAKEASAEKVTLRFVRNPERVPSFSVASFSGQTLTPSEWHGKVVILNFWATWCGPCRYEIPELMRLQKEFPGSLQVVGLSVDDAPPAQVKSFIERFGVNYPVGMASEKLQDKFGGILALPTSFVINPEGRVVQKHVGLVPQDYYTTEISYLAGKEPNVPVEKFTDVGQIFPANVKNATSIPGVDMSKLTKKQRKLAIRIMNEEHCKCGCDYTVAQCRLLDSACPVSEKMAQEVVSEILAGKVPKIGKPASTAVSTAASTR